MNKITKASLALVLIFIAILLAIFVQSLADEKKESVTDPVIAHIPIRADLDFPSPFPNPDDPTSINIIYILTPTVDVKVNVSEGIVLPEGIVFVQNNLPTGQTTLSKGKKYKYNAKIRVVKPGRWIFYVSPGVYGDVSLFEDWVTAGVQGVFDISKLPVEFHDIIDVSEEQRDVLMDVAKKWLIEYSAQEYGREEFECLQISGNPDVSCYGCEMLGYSNSTLHDRYYFVIDEDLHTNETRVRNVYHWAYQTPTGYQRRPICEEITMKGGGNGE
jgi:hypothetical protein